MFLARKITLKKWENSITSRLLYTAADAITADLRTSNNRLSLWQCREIDKSSQDIIDTVLAMGSAADQINKMDIVLLADEELRKDSQVIEYSPAETPVVDLSIQHADLCEMNYRLLGRLAYRINDAVRDERCFRFSKEEVVKILRDANQNERLNTARLSDRIKRTVI